MSGVFTGARLSCSVRREPVCVRSPRAEPHLFPCPRFRAPVLCRLESELLASRMREDDLSKHVAEARASLYVAEKTVARQRLALEQGMGGGVPTGELLFFRLPVKVFVYLSGYCEVCISAKPIVCAAATTTAAVAAAAATS